MSFELAVTVRGYELDSFGHLNNAVYINYLEQARWEAIRELDLLGYFQESRVVPVVIETLVRYIREAKLFDELKIVTSIEWDMPYLVFDHVIFHAKGGKKCCTATTKILLVTERRAPVDPPAQLLERIVRDQAALAV